MDYSVTIFVASALISSRLSQLCVSQLITKTYCPSTASAAVQSLFSSYIHPPTFWNSFIGFLSNGKSSSSLLLLPIKLYIPVTHLISLIFYIVIKFTCSSSSHLLDVPRHKLSFGSRAFRVLAPPVYNSVLLHIHQAQTLTSFRRHLETYYLQSVYLAP